jgi:WD40 repeat protein
MGVVYKARQKGLKRLVALKVILAGEHAGESEVQRFLTEAEAVARLAHPNIVQVHEIGEWKSDVSSTPMPFLSLEFVEGGNLASRLRATPQPPRLAAQLVATLANAMQYAHQHGVIHRDLKPANVLLSGDWEASVEETKTGSFHSGARRLTPNVTPKIADFGLAKQVDDSHGRTLSGTVIGSPSYMAPEQAEGHVSSIGPAADIYALGAILYEILTGRPPFKAASALETLEQVRTLEPIPPGVLQPGLNRDIETICLTCLQKSPERRYPTALALAEDLERYLTGVPIVARPVGRIERLWRWCQRNRGIASLAAGIAASLVAGTIFSTYFAVRATLGERRAHENELKAESEKLTSDRRRHVAEYRWALQKYKDGDLAEVESLLNGLRPAGDDPDLRGFECGYLERLCHLDLRTFSAHDGTVFAVDFSPGGETLYSAGSENGVWIHDLVVDRTVQLRSPSSQVFALAVSADGRKLAAAGGEYSFQQSAASNGEPPKFEQIVTIWDASSGKEIARLACPTAQPTLGVNALSFHPDGRSLAAAGLDGVVRLWDLDSLTYRPLEGHQLRVLGLAFSPNGRWLASVGRDQLVRLWDFETGEVLRAWEGHTDIINDVAWSEDGRRLATAGADSTILIWDVESGEKTIGLAGHVGEVSAVAFSPDGRLLASAGFDDNTVRVWDLASAQNILTLRGHAWHVHSVQFSPDGRTLASSDSVGVVRLWDASISQEELILRGHQGRGMSASFSSDREWVATTGDDGTLRMWSAKTGFPKWVVPGQSGRLSSVVFAPAGPLLATGGGDGSVRLWDSRDGNELARLDGHVGGVTGLAFNADGSLLASCAVDSTIAIWDVASRKKTGELLGHSKKVSAIDFSTDGGRLISVGADDKIIVFDVARMTTRIEFPVSANDAAFSPDGTRFVESGRSVRDAETGRVLLTLGTPSDKTGSVYSIAYSPDGRRIVSTGEDASVRIWDAATGLEVLTLPRNDRAGRCAAFSADGLSLAAAGDDGLVQIWTSASLTAEERDLRDAASLVRFVLSSTSSRSAATRAIRSTPGVHVRLQDRAVTLVSEVFGLSD